MVFGRFHPANFPLEKIDTIAVYAESIKSENLPEPVSPGGMCRQALLEAEIRQKSAIKLIMFNPSKFIEINTCKDLLPFSFDGSLI